MNLTRRLLNTRHGPLEFGERCLVMGILNVTPDSFSDGGEFLDSEAAIMHGCRLVSEGADILDIGAESTRPGSEGEDDEIQIDRVVGVIKGLRTAGVRQPISIDTRSASVAAAALDVGADMVNDVSGIRHDPQMPDLLRRSGVPFVVMHMQGTPATMQRSPHYMDIVAEVAAFFSETADRLARASVDCANMLIDPGIGFGKTTEHNLSLLKSLSRLAGPWPLLVGPSRKRFIGELIGDDRMELRDAGTAAVVLACSLTGADIVRVHDVATCRRLIDAMGPRTIDR